MQTPDFLWIGTQVRKVGVESLKTQRRAAPGDLAAQRAFLVASHIDAARARGQGQDRLESLDVAGLAGGCEPGRAFADVVQAGGNVGRRKSGQIALAGTLRIAFRAGQQQSARRKDRIAPRRADICPGPQQHANRCRTGLCGERLEQPLHPVSVAGRGSPQLEPGSADPQRMARWADIKAARHRHVPVGRRDDDQPGLRRKRRRRHRLGKHKGQRSPAIQALQQGRQAVAARPAAQRNHGSPAAGTFWFQIDHLSSRYVNAINDGKDVKPKRHGFPALCIATTTIRYRMARTFSLAPLAKRVAGFHDEGTT